MIRFERDVRRFHRRFGVVNGVSPHVPNPEQRAIRKRLIREETDELIEAIERGDLKGIASESIDVLYVVVGTLMVCGIRILPIWRAVHAANMRKVPNPDGGKVQKPIGWKPADIDAALAKSRKWWR